MNLKKKLYQFAHRILSENYTDHRISYKIYDLCGSDVCPVEAYYHHNGSPCILNVKLEHCRWYGGSGLSYSSTSLHPYVQTLVEYEQINHREYRGSYLERYWEAWQPANLAAYFDIDKSTAHPLLLKTPPNHNILPWLPADCISYMKNSDWLRRSDYRSLLDDGAPPARSCGPKPYWFGNTRFNHLLTIYQSIKKNGYQIDSSEREAIQYKHMEGVCLLRDNEVRILVADGQHRASALAALQHDRVPMLFYLINKRNPGIIRREEVGFWPLVQEKIFTIEQALAIFDRIFDANPPKEIKALKLTANSINRSDVKGLKSVP